MTVGSSSSGGVAVPAHQFVFATVGTDHHPFQRLVTAIDEWSSATGFPAFVQSGKSRPPRNCAYAPLLEYKMMMELMSSAIGVVSHGGPATIIQIRAAGKLPIVMPRDAARGEHVDGHQLRFARRLAEKNEIVLAESKNELHRVLAQLIDNPAVFTLRNTSSTHVAGAIQHFEQLVTQVLGRARRRSTSC